MPIYDIFSKRQKKLRGEVPEIYVYDDLPTPFRNQYVQIMNQTLALMARQTSDVNNDEFYGIVHDILCGEYGVFTLSETKPFSRFSKQNDIIDFFSTTSEIEKALDVIEVSLQIFNQFVKNNPYSNLSGILSYKANELNERFKEHGIGYQFDSGQIIRVDSAFIHTEVVKPTLQLLWNPKFQGANEEYLKAHEHYKHGRNKECLTECLKAFESTMKIICHEKGWQYDPTNPAKKMIQICFDNGLIPSYMQTQFSSLKSLFESGVPTIRNKNSGHGQGQNPIVVTDHLARYTLNLTGANIIFLVDQSGIT